MSDGILITINERGSDMVVKAVEKIATTLQALSPAAAMRLRGQALRVRVNTDKLVSAVAVKTLDVLVHKTPHDTGRARANWTTEVGTTPPAVTPQLEKFDYEGDETVAAGIAKIVGTKRQPGQSIYIVNPLEYIVPLDQGHSQQAPTGMTALALQAGRDVASNKKILT